jgi:hypothetical protein
MGSGGAPVSFVLAALIVVLVGYVSVTGLDRQREPTVTPR